MTKAKNFLVAFGVLALLLFFSATANAASAPRLDSMEVRGSDRVVYLSEDDFYPSTTDYTLKLDSSVTYLNLYIDKEDSSDIVKVEYADKSISLKNSYYRVSVDTDDLYDITVTVTDRDKEKRVYTLSLTTDNKKKGQLVDVTVTFDGYSKKARLYPAFDPSVREYAVLVPYGKANVVYFQLNLPYNCTLSDGGKKIENPGNTYEFDVTAKWGDSKSKTIKVNGDIYKFHVYFADDDASDMVRLKDLAIRDKISTSSSNDLKLDSKFDYRETEYTLDLSKKDYSKLYLYAKASDKDQLIFVENQLLTKDYWVFDPDDYQKVTVTVFAEDLREYAEYTIGIDSPVAINKLSSLKLLDANGNTINYSPALADGTFNYTAAVANDVYSVLINAQSSSPISISQNGTDYITGGIFNAFLSEGLNTFDIRVGSSVYYHLNIYRNAASTVIIPSDQYISIDGAAPQRISAYNINGNNFVKLRDIAYLLNGTTKQFSVSFDSAKNLITLVSGDRYISVGGEMAVPGTYKQAIASKQSVLLNNKTIAPAAYNIDGNNYFLLRDLAALFNFSIDFNNNIVYVNSKLGYGHTEESSAGEGTFSDISLRISGNDGNYLKRSEFDPDKKTLTIDIAKSDKEISLYAYYDQDLYDVTIKYNDEFADVSEGNYRDGYGYAIYTIDVDTNDLHNITVTFKNDVGEKATYTLKLRAE